MADKDNDNDDYFLTDTILISLIEQHKKDIPKVWSTYIWKNSLAI